MKKRKMINLFLCFALALGVAVPIAMAIPTYADGRLEEKDVMVVIATDSVASESKNSGDSGKENENSGNSEDIEAATSSNATSSNATKPTPGGEFKHIDTCVEGCTGEGCVCPCHKMSLFERIMACTTIDEIFAIVDETPIEELEALTEEENAEISAYIEFLEPEPLPEVVIEESDSPVESEVVTQEAVSFTNVAPFGDPVIGGDE